VGLELAGLEEAKGHALKTLPDIAKDDLPEGDRREFTIEVRDKTGRPVLIARLYLSVERINERR
jgi:hypothetical protein